MSDSQPSFDEFKAELEALFGHPLTESVEVAAKGFWENWSSFSLAISKRSLAVHTDALRLGTQFSEYKRYHVWKGRRDCGASCGPRHGVVLVALGSRVHCRWYSPSYVGQPGKV